ncbi:MAG: nucleotidyltransferase domain-containing protein [Nanoarchaeota archaeon]
MLPEPLKILESVSKKFYKENKKEVLDIILFGSVLKGKEKPKDIDILLLFKEKNNLDLMQKLRKSLELLADKPIEVTGKTYSELFSESFTAREALLSEGYSLINNVSLAKGMGYQPRVMFNYNLKGKNKSERMRFYYSLYGRGVPGILKKLNSIKYTDTIIICPIEHQEEMRNFLDSWKIEFKDTPILIPSRMVL